MNKKTLLITSGIIIISLLNANSVHAEVNVDLEVTKTKKELVHNSGEESLFNLSIDEEDLTKITDGSLNNHQAKFNEIVEKIEELLNDEQKEALKEILSEKNEVYSLFKEAITAHESGDFIQASKLYDQLLTIDSLSKLTVELLDFFNSLSLTESYLTDPLNYETIEGDSSEEQKGPIEDKTEHESQNNPEDSENEEGVAPESNENSTEDISEDTNENSTSSEMPMEKEQIGVSQKKPYKTIEEYYVDVHNSNSVSERWYLAQEMKKLYKTDPRVIETINFSANSSLNYGQRLHQAGNYRDSISYYNRIINESLVDDWIKKKAITFKDQAERNTLYTTAEDYYNVIRKSNSVSEKWKLAQISKELFKTGTYVTEGINVAARSSLNYGIRLHKAKDFESAIIYYTRVINEPLVYSTVRTPAIAYKIQAESKSIHQTAEDYYNAIRKSNSVSEKWKLAQTAKELFKTGTYVTEGINVAARSSLNYGIRLHKAKDFESAITYYTRVINEPLVYSTVRTPALAYKIQAESKSVHQTAEDYYNAIRKSNSVSEKWKLAQTAKELFKTGTYVTEGINVAARSSLNYGIRLHKAKDFESAITYYTRVINEPLVYSTVRTPALAYKIQAESKSVHQTAEDYYNAIRKSNSVSEKWKLAQISKELFKTGTYVIEGINVAARSNLNYGIKLHNNKNFKLAINYYNRVIDEPLVEPLLLNKAESYSYLARNNLNLTNIVIRKENYDIKLDNFIDIQMTNNPQKWTKNGWINAKREEVLYHVNPLNSTSASDSGMLYLLATGNTDPLQHLKLSYSIGIPATELNIIVSEKGILHKMGEVFSKASKKSSINELYLIAHAILETGHGTSDLATGIEVKEVNGIPVKPRVVYNMFGIGAFDKNPNKYGSEKAYELGWFTPEEAIIGGAEWVAKNYIHNSFYNQDTLYKMKWNIKNPSHQYATDVAWAYNQTYIFKNIVSLSQKYDLVLNFEVPNFK